MSIFSSMLISPPTTVSILLGLFLPYYIYRRCPYLVRGSGIVWAILCVYEWLICGVDKNTICNDNVLLNSTFCCWWMLLNQTNRLSIVAGVVFCTSLFIKYWWIIKIDYFKDMTNIGGDGAGRRRTIGKIPPVYPNGWIPILESRDLHIGKVKSVSVLGNELAVFRGENGNAYVLDAYCPHLGANLGVGGQVMGNCIECPFHGWQFDGEDGRCVHIPYAKRVPDVAKTRCWTSCEVNGFIHVWYHVEGEKPTWEIPEVEEITKGAWIYRGRTEHVVHCHIQDIAENGADVAHLHQLHSASVFSGANIENLIRLWTFMKHDWEPNWEQCTDTPHIAKVDLSQHVSLFNVKIPFTNIKMDIRQIGPAMVHLIIAKSICGQGVYLQNIIPEGPMVQRIIHHLYTDPYFGQWSSNNLLMGTAIMLERDIMIWNNKKFLHNPILLKEDKLISRYRRWYSQFYSENSPTEKEMREKTLDW